MHKFLFITCFLFFLCPKISANTSLTLREGDTLEKISKEYNTSIREIMDFNDIYDGREIRAGDIIKIPQSVNEDYILSHTVIHGDTLTKISKMYGLLTSQIISLNRLSNPSELLPGQILILPKGTRKIKRITSSDSKNTKIETYHLVSETENLTRISKLHNIPVDQIVQLNQLDSPDQIKVGSKLLLHRNKTNKGQEISNFGPLKLDLTKVYYLSGSYVFLAINDRGQLFHMALECNHRRLNSTIKNKQWGEWYFPQEDFEYKLINELCKNINYSSN